MEDELEVFAVAVHGALAFGHLLGLFYNLRRKNAFDSFAHGAAFVYDCWATRKHAQRLSRKELPS